jgi:hypothetical protein
VADRKNLRDALDNIVGPGAQHERTCDAAEHDEDGPCIWCAARHALADDTSSSTPARDDRLHESANRLLAEIVSLLDWFDLTKEDDMSRLHSMALQPLRELRDYIISEVPSSPPARGPAVPELIHEVDLRKHGDGENIGITARFAAELQAEGVIYTRQCISTYALTNPDDQDAIRRIVDGD